MFCSLESTHIRHAHTVAHHLKPSYDPVFKQVDIVSCNHSSLLFVITSSRLELSTQSKYAFSHVRCPMVKNLKVDGELHILRCSFDIVASGQCSPQKISCCESCVNRMCTNNHLLHWCCTLQPAASMTHHTKDKCVSRS